MKSYFTELGEEKVKDGFGEFVQYHILDKIKIKGNYKDGKLDGLRRGWHENGNVWFNSYYKDGKPLRKEQVETH